MPDRGGLRPRPLSTLLLSLNLVLLVRLISGSCSHRTVLTARQGTITDGPEKYTESSHCEWLIDAGGPSKTILLSFNKMETECSFDFLFVYDGNSYDSRLIATFSGDSLPPNVTAYSGHMLLYLFSDSDYVLHGFEARYEISDCPWNCSGHGVCHDHKCHCSSSYGGLGCEVEHCPKNCGPHGRCGIDSRQHKCICDPGYTGQACDLLVAGAGGEGRWYTISDKQSGTAFSARTAHAAVYNHDCLWVFGGFDLNSMKDDLLHFCLKENVWSEVKKLTQTHSSAPPEQITNPIPWDLSLLEEQTTSVSSVMPNTSLPTSEKFVTAETTHSRRKSSSRARRSDRSLMSEAGKWPAARSGHAMDKFEDGFFVFGGRLSDESLSNELWFFNISSMEWRLCAEHSKVRPLKMHGHTLTTVEDYLYSIGGTNEDHYFVDKIYRISASIPDQWETVQIWGGVHTPPRFVGHSTVYHAHSRSLFIFGGYIQNSGLFSDRSNDIYTFQLETRYWSRLNVKGLHPWRRAFHSGLLMGQYLVVYGGKTRRDKLEICYNNEVFFYHLGCHRWLNHAYFVGNATLPRKGRFGHSAVVTNGNIMFIIGGYSGQVLDDLLAYKVPDAIADFECAQGSELCLPETATSSSQDRDHCESYALRQPACQDDPECVFCRQGRTDGGGPHNASCLHRSRVKLCVEQDYHDTSDRCPGICPTLQTCGACVGHRPTTHKNANNEKDTVNNSSHLNTTANSTDPFGLDYLSINTTGSGLEAEWVSNTSSLMAADGHRPRRWRTYTAECTWCVKEAECQAASALSGTCQSANDTLSGLEGWWGGLSASLTTLHQCQTQDFPAGLHFLKYRNDFNDTFPDEVSIVRRPKEKLSYSRSKRTEKTFLYKSKFLGFIHPLGAEPRLGEHLNLYLSVSEGIGELFISTDATEEHKERVVGQSETLTYKTNRARRLKDLPVFPNVTRGNKYFIEQITEQRKKGLIVPKTEISLEWDGGLSAAVKVIRQPISSEFLEPFRKGNCSGNYNCLSCLSDTLCGWCELRRVCVRRNVTPSFCEVAASGEGQYLITSPVECPHCQKHIQCYNCTQDNLCEWHQENGHCMRRYRHNNSVEVVRDTRMCLPPCHQRANCSECVGRKSECIWCHNTRSCLPFSNYGTHYVYGHCTSWKDSSSLQHKCMRCEERRNCTSCLTQFGCGWCGLAHNPKLGVCVDGDFAGMSGNRSCSHLLYQMFALTVLDIPGLVSSPDVTETPTSTSTSVFSSGEVDVPQPLPASIWAYDSCPEKCSHKCLHGWCSGAPHYECVCKLGWTGPSCDQDCGCNYHSTCGRGTGICDKCQNFTAGPDCSECAPGAWRDPSSTTEGCQECKCNGHSDPEQSHCNVTNGHCYCKDNTAGINCERCSPGYFGSPRDNGVCYKRCDARTFLTNSYYGAMGEYIEDIESRLNRYYIQKRSTFHLKGARGNMTHCLWIISPTDDVLGAVRDQSPVYSITVTGKVPCGESAVYVYDGIPEFISGTENQESRELGAFCGQTKRQSMTVYATSGVVTIFFEGDLIEDYGTEFTCRYHAFACKTGCGQNQVCENNSCVCKTGFFGPACLSLICPNNCSGEQRGHCQNGLCICKRGFTGADCSKSVETFLPNIQLITDSALAQSPLKIPPTNDFSHLPGQLTTPSGEDDPGPSARSGHTLTSCGGELAFLYGGYSPQEGILDDLWMLNMTVSTWSRVSPLGEGLSPGGRYYHSAACIQVEKMIYVFGGFASQEDASVQPTKTIWKFNVLSHVWKQAIDPPSWMPALAGHTLTPAGPTLLVVIGGYSVNDTFSDKVFEYNTSRPVFAWTEINHRQMSGDRLQGELQSIVDAGLYGHSAVYDPFTHKVYVYGGYLPQDRRLVLSNVLFEYQIRNRKWRLKQSNSQTYMENEARAFHTSVHLGDFMAIIGGVTRGRYGEDILLYRFGCEDFITVKLKGQLSDATAAVGLTAVATKDGDVYIFGGYANSARGKLLRLRLPTDPCSSIGDAESCRNYENCHFADLTGILDSNGTRLQRCQTEPFYKRCGFWNHRDEGRACRESMTCSSCLRAAKNCVWCWGCGVGTCLTQTQACPPPYLNCSLSTSINQASKCWRCSETDGCLTSVLYKRSIDLKPHALRKQIFIHHECHEFTSCDECLALNEHKEAVCVWSEALHECLAKSYTPLRCSMGECHYLRNRQQMCPVSCMSYTMCGDCVAATGCGWCSKEGSNGEGFCMEGGIEGPTQGGSCKAGNITLLVSELHNFPEEKKPLDWKPNWAYHECPPENECGNGHHTCDVGKTQTCFDYEAGYACPCKTGYVKKMGDPSSCKPHCNPRCVHGKCVEHNKCECDFGYVGRNCTVECNCNKHSNCQDENSTTKCTKCEHNTQGQFCHECKPMFVGNAKNGGECIPCLEFCNGHTNTCMTLDESVRPVHMFDYLSFVQGPRPNQAVCKSCQHNTTGNKCQDCTLGHFRRGTDSKTKPCQPCHCHGHSFECDPKTGEQCMCQNNTETPSCSNSDEVECWQLQCIKCKEYFLGTPTNGHQCYRSMTSDKDFCFDPVTQNKCNQGPAPLLKGRTVFFVVQPRYLNVDIRVTIDVIAGKTDIYLSNKKDTFQVFVDKETGMHDIYLDKTYVSAQPGMSKRSANSDSDETEGDTDQSVRITDSVPDYLRLHPTDEDYYKLSQFESMDVVDETEEEKEKYKEEEEKEESEADDSWERKKPVRYHGSDRHRTHSRHRWNKRKHWKRHRSLYRKIKEQFPNETSEDMQNLLAFLKELELNPGDARGMRRRRQARHRNKPRKARGFDFDHIFSKANYQKKSLAHYASQRNDEKRKPARRATTVTDGIRSQGRHGFNPRNQGHNSGGGSSRSVHSSSSKRNNSGGHRKGKGLKMGEIEAGRLNTYITVGQHNSVLVVRNVQFRLVITLPRDQHNLGSSHFYIILRSLEGSDTGENSIHVNQWSGDGGREGASKGPTRGTLYFRQDQPHIDLFVFFSVFFSCFFLFLAVCVLLWKMKQTLDARRTRQLQEREMECMASRPFAHILVLIDPVTDSSSVNTSDGGESGDIVPNSFLTRSLCQLTRQRSKLGRYHGGGLRGGNNQQQLEHYMTTNPCNNIILTTTGRGGGDINTIVTSNSIMALNSFSAPPHRTSTQRELGVLPIAFEPTEDNLAGVGTVVFQLPGGAAAPSHLCLGSALTTRISIPPSSHHHSHKSASLRRRTSTTYC
ncbi:multiple epidermal growth factor-like domains protein 8 [Elysia marginata]|uniref:Multiple epidermal growth factor-like domains protein 8 n=1 Tax=Elysia marginata TaxID=1093978 RepID=A0AAV4IZN6_9GAST|nr:multiple epidermal growth factor-like domains protein 8 [Elysia marginata]